LSRRVVLAAALGLALAAAGCRFRELPKNPLASEISVEDEIELGANIHKQVRASAPMVNDPILLDFVNAIGQELVATTEPQPFTYRFSIVKNDELNAFAVPGGYIYIHSAVLAQAGDLDELAGVLAHEVAHVKQRHIARAQAEQGLTSYATLAAIIAGMAAGDPKVAAAVTTIATGINVGLQLKYSRAHEAEADREGIGYLIRTGFDPRGLVRFLERIAATQRGPGAEIPPYLYSHPAVVERIDDNRRQIARLGIPNAPIRRDPRLVAAQARLAALSQPVAGGSGLLARASFDAALTDPLLADAAAARARGDTKTADRILAGAEELEPNDPRVPLARAELAEERGDLESAAAELTRAFRLDPNVPLVQYELGRVHKRLGHKSRAVFYLEQAAANFTPGTSAQRRAEFEIEALSWPVLENSGISSEEGGADRRSFAAGEPVVWWGRVSPRFAVQPLEYQARWVDPNGNVASRETLQPGVRRFLSARLDTTRALPGRWQVRVFAGDGPVEERGFEISPATPAEPLR
jgi:predicted Zn-dependent protease